MLAFSTVFSGRPVRVDNGIGRDGFIDTKLLEHWGVSSYVNGIWGSAGKAVQLARGRIAAGVQIRVRDAITRLDLVEKYRQKDMARYAGGNNSHMRYSSRSKLPDKSLIQC